MKKMKEEQLNNKCATFAGKYIEAKFKGGSQVERNLVLNSLAHGMYMGVRFAEKTYTSFWFKFLPKIIDSEYIEKHGIKASNFYLKKKGYSKLQWHEQALIRASVSTGFREGFQCVE